jgi:anti-sigma regulatory factor (Ser/Thr protein kinase)
VHWLVHKLMQKNGASACAKFLCIGPLQSRRACGKMPFTAHVLLTAANAPDRTAMTELAGLARSVASDTSFSCQWIAPALRMAAMASGNWPLSTRPSGAGWTSLPRIALRTPRPDARSVRAGRDFTIATMQRWGAAERADDIAMVVSELLTNALRHALPDVGRVPRPGSVRLALLQPGRCVLCAVADPSPKTPTPRQPEILGEGGRGLHVISALSDIWGCTPPSHAGKVVWALFSLKHLVTHRPGPDGPVRLVEPGS